ncbi:MAG TPA: TraR/DksA C4-type zinc finger protein [Acidimicrobiales bacterium]|jgi:RNA polymerase-binding transcription factor DksA|nr:TraR/DksA C4-type zinc finger protein [Acidimicrobiales bacterium]
MSQITVAPDAPQELEDLGRMLAAERERAETRVADLRTELEGLDTNPEIEVSFDDEDSEGATTGLERDRVASLLAAARQHREELDEALTRLEAGAYGRCESCGQPIPRERLEALPTARFCVACLTPDPLRRAR